MKKSIIAIFALWLGFLFADAKPQANFQVNIESAKKYLDMAQQASSGTMPSDTDWDILFATAAYKELFNKVDWDKQEFQNNVREAFDIAYNPAKSEKRDSIALSLDEIDLSTLDTELPLFVSTAISIKNNLSKYTEIINSINIDNVIDEANTLALGLLPNNGHGITPEPCPIYFIIWDLECRALGDALFLDVNTFFFDGLQAATDALAHEMHHFYLMPVFNIVYKEDIMDGAVLALVNNMREGVADILNKKQMPLKSLAPYGKKVLEAYNSDYENTPNVLAQLDSVTCEFLDGKIDIEKYFQKAFECVHYEGHTTGSFMVFLIRDQLGIDAVVESVGNLDAFIDNYNKAATKAGTYRFSDKFTQHIHNVSIPAKRGS